ncbi:sensor histidine kinase [Loktanella sp. DJP18]|uniref:sensor histidine kinase n=1 Tax=Loktanella sp. DJP18 TaxID=3409788 RepID=UPI003BB8050B
MTHDRNVHGDRWPFLHSLPFRVVAFLSLALLPIGLLAVWQTQNLDETLRARTELSLVALTEIAVSGERQTLQRALGAARGQSVTYSMTEEDPAACSAAFKAFRDADPSISFAGFLPVEGPIVCSSEDAPITVAPTSRLRQIAGATSNNLTAQMRLDDTGRRVAVLTQPVTQDNAVIGQIVLALPTDLMSAARDLDNQAPPIALTIFNGEGQVIVTQGQAMERGEVVVGDDVLDRLGASPKAFFGRSQSGERRVFIVLTLVPGLAYAMTEWATTEGFLATNAIALPSVLLPALMWLASLLVAYFAVHRLVVSPVQDLGARMRRFASNRSLQQPKGTDMLPQELFDLEQTFVNMAYDLIDDEARMENSLREKNVLLKEVHHRVKNNLQMISSIINMQIRTSSSSESRQALRRLQDRVIGLATVHRLLYQSKEVARADASSLLQNVCAGLFAQLHEQRPGATHTLEVDRFTLVPDQAVPLALLAGEVGTKAIQQMPQGSGENVFLHISVRIVSPGMAQFRCRSSSDQPVTPQNQHKGVGWQLIRAFALQLGGKLERRQDEGVHIISVEFPITTAIPDAMDY